METSPLAQHAPNGAGRHRSPWKIAAWTAPLLLMLGMWVMTRSVQASGAGEGWSPGDYVFASLILYGALGAYEVVSRMGRGNTLYRAAAGLGIGTAVLMVWSIAAVGLTDTDADAFYLVPLALGFVGALVARFRPRGMARALFVTAAATGLVGVVALLAGAVAPHNSVLQILGISGFFAVLFAGSAVLFNEAAEGRTTLGAA
ncbi:MAG TPA: hypothetical protein VK610_10050 [Rhodothermales bacterium]|nr:hypothetical protein [Rhodothermales bacterium]